MGYTYVESEIIGPTGTSAPVRLLVDTGALFTLIPEPVWREAGLTAERIRKFVLADGTLIERKIADCRIRLPQFGEYTTPVILGESNDKALLGVITLEVFGITVDPSTGHLYELDVLPLMSVA
jgi:predicted aspartyl protease